MDLIHGERQTDAASTLVAATAGTLAIQLLAGESLGTNFGRSLMTFGGTIALAESVADLVSPRVSQLLGMSNYMETIAIRSGVVLGATYGMFMIAGAPSLTAAAGAAIGAAVGEYMYDNMMSYKSVGLQMKKK